uniref:Uncharacterized protein n=1 Tax=Arundo donax TaxID=35708 RepID=A0A0A8ZRQ0_ARUDO
MALFFFPRTQMAILSFPENTNGYTFSPREHKWLCLHLWKRTYQSIYTILRFSIIDTVDFQIRCLTIKFSIVNK